MSRTVDCVCGTRLRVPSRDKTLKMRCPTCNRSLLVSPEPRVSKPESKPAPQPKQALPTATTVASSDFVLLHCSCKQPLKVPRSALGKALRCPKCGAVSTMAKAGQQPAATPTKPAETKPQINQAAPVQPVGNIPNAIPVATPVVAQPVTAVQPTAPASDFGGFDYPPVDHGNAPPPPTGHPTNRKPARRASNAAKPGSLPTLIVQWSITSMFVISTLAVLVTLVSFGVKAKLNNDAKNYNRLRPSSFEEASALRKTAVEQAEVSKTVHKVLHYCNATLQATFLIASLVCAVGLILSIAKSTGPLVACLIITTLLLFSFVILDGVKRTGASFTYQTDGLMFVEKPAATMGSAAILAGKWGGERYGSLIWTAATIEMLLGGFLAGFGASSLLRRRQLHAGSLALPIAMIASSVSYIVIMLWLARSLSGLDFFDNGGIQSTMTLVLFFTLPVLLLIAMLIAISDAKKVKTARR